MCHYREVVLRTNEILARPADTTSVPPAVRSVKVTVPIVCHTANNRPSRLSGTPSPTKQIACELHLSEGTVKEYLYRILLHVSSRTEPALRLYCEGLLGGIT